MAPESQRSFLLRHLDLPATLVDADAGAALVRRARREAAELLATEGYFSPQIDARADAAEALAIVVAPGPLTRVARIDIEFLGDLAAAEGEMAERRERLRAAWSLKAGAAFRSADWQAAKAALLADAAATDHAAARIVSSRADVDPERAEVQLAVTLDSGPAYRFGALAITGLRRYDAALVAGLAPFAPGEPYRRAALLEFQSRLQNSPWFGAVTIEAVPTAAAETIPVRVTLAEAPAQRVGFGLGYGTNSGARGEFNYRHHDFLGRAWDLNSGLRLEERRQSLSAELGLLADARGYRPSFGAQLETSDIQGLVSTRQVLGVARSRNAGRIETRLGLEWQREELRTAGAAAERKRALTLDWRWIRRAADDALNPRRGNVVELRLGGAAQRLLSDRDFVRSHLRVQQWWPLGAADSLMLRGEAGYTAAVARSGIPQDYLFRAGGAQSVRGYAYQSLGVRAGNAVVGGRALLAGALEYTHWLDGPWGAAFFVDAGDAADSWREIKPAAGVGAGARWKSPVGPLALDLARGTRGGRWHLHFALMVAF